MNIIEESLKNKEENNKKKVLKTILALIILVVLIIVGISIYMVQLQNSIMRIHIDGRENERLKNLLVFEEDGTIYAPIKEIASYFSYESYNGEYSDRSEDQSKAYVINEKEVANLELGSDKIYKLDLTTRTSNYEVVTTERPVKAINGVLYASTETIEKAFNIVFQQDGSGNNIQIYTLPYLINSYSKSILNHGYVELSEEFINQKAIVQGLLVVKRDQINKQFGVIDLEGRPVIEAKYDAVTYFSNTGDFLVKTNSKTGIISKTRETKVPIVYDSIEMMDNNSGLYIVKRDNKFGVIDINGNIKIHIEQDEIGIDASKFVRNDIKNNYILANHYIPVRRDKLWALYSIEGQQLTEFKYDSLGNITSNIRDALNLIVVPDYNVLVVSKDKKYSLINTLGEEIFPVVADDIYMEIKEGQKYYYVVANNGTMDVTVLLENLGIRKVGR